MKSRQKMTAAAFLGLSGVAVLVSCTSAEKQAAGSSPARSAASVSDYVEPAVSTNFIEQINDTSGLGHLSDAAAQLQRTERVFTFARNQPSALFKELRARSPIFKLPGGAGKYIMKGKNIPSIFVITKHADVLEALDANDVFTVDTYRQIMDATVGHPFMLGRENTKYNDEKPGMRHMLNKNDLGRVRMIIRQLAQEAIKDGTEKDGTIDVVKHVSRHVPLGLNSEYFGFPGPSREHMAKWSRHSQHAFFHNPFYDLLSKPKNDKKAIASGKEMRDYVTNVLVPSRKVELQNGRPAYDPVSRMIAGHAKIGMSDDRIVANTIGLLVGSVETTSAAITQALEYLMDHPQLFAGALQAAKAGDDKLFDAYVWEALRFNPINPWVGRFVRDPRVAPKDPADASAETAKARETRQKRMSDPRVTDAGFILAKGTPRETVIPWGSVILASSESAMQDGEVFTNPDEFRLDRPYSAYMHLGYGYHRCLGDDVSLVMVPETIKQLMLLPNLDRKNRDKRIDYDGGPFPEKWVLKYDAGPRPKRVAEFKKSIRDTLKMLTLGEFIIERLRSMEKKEEAKKAIRNLFGKEQEKQAAIKELPALIQNAMQDFDKAEVVDACMNKNPKSVETFPNENDRRNYCEVNVAFRGCYFVQRLINGQSSQHAFNHCAYGAHVNGKGYLSEQEIADFKNKFRHLELFSFLQYHE